MKHLDNYSGPSAGEVLDQTLLRRGGKSPGGFPIYRLVWSESVLEKKGGRWVDWDETVPIEDRGRPSRILGQDGKPIDIIRPIRTVIEVRETHKYDDINPPGWLLERWFPAHMWGTPEWWRAQVLLPDYDGPYEYDEHFNWVPKFTAVDFGQGVPLLGPYPERGAYGQIAGPFPMVPGVDFLLDVIAGQQRMAETILSKGVDQWVKERVYKAEQKYEKEREAALSESHYRLVHEMTFIGEGTNLGHGRLRNKAAEAAGITSHMGN